MNGKKVLLLLLCFFILSFATARNAHYSSDSYGLAITWTDEVASGDAVIFSMTVTDGTASLSTENGASSIKLIRNATGKSPGFSDLFVVCQEPLLLYGAIPLSTMLNPGTFTLIVTYRVTDGSQMEFTLPVTVNEKEFVEEIIPLNSKNTAIKTDDSPERAAQIDKLNEILGTTDPDAVYFEGTFIVPVNSTRRTAFFGDRRTYRYTNGKTETSLHYGIDFGVPEGTAVQACGDGKVVLAEWRNSTGWSIVIEHLPGLYSLYYHLSKMLVSEGDKVKQGQKIALSGSTGLATGPHLHWEVRLLMNAINPDQLVETPLY